MLITMPARPDRSRGFTLIEVLGALVVVAVLVSIAMPAYTSHVRKARRADALAAIAAVQQAQERHRANHLLYATHFIVADGQWTGLGASTDANAATALVAAGGHYRLTIDGADTAGYRIVATARGDQARDVGCAVLRASVQGAQWRHESGPTAALGNDAPANRRCWSR